MSALAAPGDVLQTPQTPMELPVEIEVETGIAGLKQAPLWKELVQLLENPYLAPVDGTDFAPSGVERRPAFRQPGDPRGPLLAPLNVWPLSYNFLTAQPLRLRTSDGEVSLDQPGPLFDPDEVVAPNDFNVPTEARTPIGALVACPLDPTGIYYAIINDGPGGFPAGQNPCGNPNDPTAPDGSLVVFNPGGNGNNPNSPRGRVGFGGNGQHPSIPPNGTVVAVPAVVGGVLYEGEIDPATGEVEFEPVVELEEPVNEEHFFREEGDTNGLSQELIDLDLSGREAAEVLGKALFWDMQVGSDGVQACGSCHFHAGADNRTRGQLNPNTSGGDLTLQVKGPNQDVVVSDFPFHMLADPEVSGESTNSRRFGHAIHPPVQSCQFGKQNTAIPHPALGPVCGEDTGSFADDHTCDALRGNRGGGKLDGGESHSRPERMQLGG